MVWFCRICNNPSISFICSLILHILNLIRGSSQQRHCRKLGLDGKIFGIFIFVVHRFRVDCFAIGFAFSLMFRSPTSWLVSKGEANEHSPRNNRGKL